MPISCKCESNYPWKTKHAQEIWLFTRLCLEIVSGKYIVDFNDPRSLHAVISNNLNEPANFKRKSWVKLVYDGAAEGTNLDFQKNKEDWGFSIHTKKQNVEGIKWFKLVAVPAWAFYVISIVRILHAHSGVYLSVSMYVCLSIYIICLSIYLTVSL